eukprot:4405838-Amphidinium_carterae.2
MGSGVEQNEYSEYPGASEADFELSESEWLDQDTLEAQAFAMQARKGKSKGKGKTQKQMYPSGSGGSQTTDGSQRSPQVQQERARRLAALRAKTRCLTCGQYGHWSRDKVCKGSGSKKGGNTTSAYFVLTKDSPQGSTLHSCAVWARSQTSMDVMPFWCEHIDCHTCNSERGYWVHAPCDMQDVSLALGLWTHLITILYTHKNRTALRTRGFLRIAGRSIAALVAEANTQGTRAAHLSEEWMMVGFPSSFEHLFSQQTTDENLGLWLQSFVLSVPGNQEVQSLLSDVSMQTWIHEAYAIRQKAESHVRTQSSVAEAMKLQSTERIAQWERVPVRILEKLYRFHIGMGHISLKFSHSAMMRMLKRAGAHPDILRLGSKTSSWRLRLQSTVGLDVFYVQDGMRQTFKCLNIACLQTQFQFVSVLEAGTGPSNSALVIEHFGTVWCSWAGYPHSIQADLGKEFMGSFHTVNLKDKANPLGGSVAARSSRAFGWFLQGLAEVRLAAGIISRARNDSARIGGYALAQWLLCSHGPRLPGSLMDDEEALKLEVHEAALDPQSSMARNLAIRESARIACIRLDNDSRIRRAILRNQQTVDPSLLVEGLAVYYHKQQLGHEQTSYCQLIGMDLLARIIGFEGQSKQRVWLRQAGTTVVVSAQQIRHALPEEIECFDCFSASDLQGAEVSRTYLDVQQGHLGMSQNELELSVPGKRFPGMSIQGTSHEDVVRFNDNVNSQPKGHWCLSGVLVGTPEIPSTADSRGVRWLLRLRLGVLSLDRRACRREE